jgi:hypothetical protein
VRLPPLTAEALLWLAGPVVLSLATLVIGLALRRHHRLAGRALVLLSIVGLFLSASWIALVMRVEAIEHDSVGRLPQHGALAMQEPHRPRWNPAAALELE